MEEKRPHFVFHFDSVLKIYTQVSQGFKTIREARDFKESMERTGKKGLIIFKQVD